MKANSYHIALLTALFVTLLVPFNAFAQEGKLSIEPEIASKELKQDAEAPSGTDNPEPRTLKNSTPSPSIQEPVLLRDSDGKNAKSTMKSVEKAQKDEEKAQKEDEDPLSFNFLYYIIEKFKFSDIVE